MNYPKISIVTPNYNGGEYLESTIKSLLDQNYPNLEYIVIDGGSTDNSLEIISKYHNRISYFISEKDGGLYEAVDKGFKQATGEIMGWLNSDDMHHPQSLYAIAEIFTTFTQVSWLMGNPSYFDEKGRIIHCWGIFHASKYDYMINKGAWLQQESTFWRNTLWQKAGAYISTSYKFAGDFELWTRFFRIEELYITDTLLAGFRFRSKNQLTLEHFDDYASEVKIIKQLNIPYVDKRVLKRYKLYRDIITRLVRLKVFNYNYFDQLSRRITGGRNKVISFDRARQQYTISG
jgi:glycosyltransferase involved in cell wall biosynthesis